MGHLGDSLSDCDRVFTSDSEEETLQREEDPEPTENEVATQIEEDSQPSSNVEATPTEEDSGEACPPQSKEVEMTIEANEGDETETLATMCGVFNPEVDPDELEEEVRLMDSWLAL